MPKVFIIGDSHTHALKQALKGGFTGADISVRRLSKIKNDTRIGDISFEGFLSECAGLSVDDIVVCAIGGNQHSAMSLIQHPVPYDIHSQPDEQQSPRQDITYVPRNLIKDRLAQGLKGGDGAKITQIAAQGPFRTLHLTPPPPKENADYILNRPETDFLRKGILEAGVSDAAMRQRIWILQNEVMADLLDAAKVQMLPVPQAAMTPDGFLHPDYYGPDATHANAAYGALVLEQIAATLKQP